MRTATILLLLALFLPANAVADDNDCTTDPDKFWLCSGDEAWVSGYLIAPEVFDLRKCEVWEKKAELLPQVQTERDECMQQRDDSLAELKLQEDRANKLAAEYDQCALDYSKCTQLLVEAEDELEDSYDTLDVVLIAGGTGVGAVVVGILIGIFAI